MIKSLYPQFQKWSATGSVYIISDTHFDDADCKLMNPNWITPEEHMAILKKNIHKGDTLIHLGDVGNADYLDELKCYKVLITGNHDILSKVASHFNEVYTGPLFIADRILLSHEPIYGMEKFALNLHGHVHNGAFVSYHDTGSRFVVSHINFASDVSQWQPANLGAMIKEGFLSDFPNYHRVTIDAATDKKKLKEIINNNPITGFLEINPNPTDPCKFFKREDFSNLACGTCPNNPKNDGSGICNCTLGSPTIT